MAEALTVIANPAASGGAGGRVIPRIEEGLRARSFRFALLRTEAPGHAVELAREAVQGGTRRILTVGGDGTIHEVANGMLEGGGGDPPCELAMVPVGTGNDFFRMVGARPRLEDALDLLQTGVARAFEVGLVKWGDKERHFINLFGVGIDVEVLRRRENFKRLSGLPQYLAGLVSAVIHYSPLALRVILDGDEVIEDRTMLSAVTVGPSIGGGFLVNPDATPFDGLLDLCFVDALGLLDTARYVPRVIRGTHKNLPVVKMRQFKSLRFESLEGTPFHFELDGEVVDDVTTALEVEVLPARLPVIVSREVQ